MRELSVKCVNNSANDVDFCLFQKFTIEPNFVQTKKSVVWLHKPCHKTVSAAFTWEDSLFFVGGKVGINMNKPYEYSIFSAADPDITGKNAVKLIKNQDDLYKFEIDMEPTGRNLLWIAASPEVAKTGVFVGLGMKSKDELYSAIVFAAQPNAVYGFTAKVDYYVTFAKKYNQGYAITEMDEKNACKLRFPSNKMIAVLRNDNTFAIRQDNTD